MFNATGSSAGACRTARWMGPGQEEPAVEGDHSPYAPHASPLAHAPDHAAWSRGTAARLPCLVCGRAGKGRVKLPKPSQPGRAFAPVTSRSVAVTVTVCVTLQVHRRGGGVTSPSHCEGWTNVAADRVKGCAVSWGGMPALVLCCTV